MSGRIERFEDFIAWQKARSLTAEIYQLTGRGSFARDFGLKDQVTRAAVSIMSNIAEGFEKGRSTEFHQLLSVAKASSAELRSLLYVARDAGYVDDAGFRALLDMTEEAGRLVGGLRSSVERRRDSA
ncbi:MAG: four helix bundle protein [Phycisphaerae bacterium]|nr:four helix bundle protein [Phycisphaerae bacterium]